MVHNNVRSTELFRQKGIEMKTAFIFGLILSAYAYCNFMALDESAMRADLILANIHELDK